ncbi:MULTISPECIES: class I adenylate-forming enzyme family protein [Pseudomonas]|uniref:class I adenylate-forming enzyme family protein n=1 Tax=Pseudomonas nitroreducens TaxID=46680 RepID=UPI001E57F592|nr:MULTISPECIES: class I adenylate-forming enzyme family protein [Pseudomonas]MCE4071492.1 acyl--CoA ligase [Pseudomonas nitritireducens]MCE4081268.1 acyl--CoA ligase [Pseudomonas nitroreducens]
MTNGLGERIEAVMALDPARGAFEYRGEWCTWQSVADMAHRIEEMLQVAGLGPGMPIGILLRNRPAHVVAVMQVIASRRCVVALNPFQHPQKIADDLRRLNLAVLIADEEDWQVGELLEASRAVGSLGISIRSQPVLRVDRVAGLENLDPARKFAEPQPDICILMLTSGTTGPAKRIQLEYGNFERALFDSMHYESRGGKEQLQLKATAGLLCTPLVHIGGMYFAMLAIVGARPLAILEKFTVEEFVRVVSEHQARTVSLPPTAIRMIIDAQVPPEKLASLLAIRTGSSPLDPAMAEEFERIYGFPLLDTYGATEFAGAVAGWTLKDHRLYSKDKRGSVGRAQPGCELRVVSAEDGSVLGTGEVGLLEVRTAQVDANRWLRTTDLAEIDGDGFLFIRGRADDAIMRGGFKVLPRDVEKILREHPAVHEACVVGLADDRLGAIPVAAVQLQLGVPAVTPEELLGFARQRLVAYQVPAQLKIVEALPRTPSLKVSQHEVRALFAK